MEEHLRTGRSFGLRTTLANDPLAERAVTAARAAGYRVHCHFIGAGSAQLTTSRARTSRTDLANDAAALWHMARERLAATADQYDVIAAGPKPERRTGDDAPLREPDTDVRG